MPNLLVRSNLFGIVKKGKSNFVEGRLLITQGNGKREKSPDGPYKKNPESTVSKFDFLNWESCSF